MTLAAFRSSLSVRAVIALAGVFAGYIVLRDRFAAFDTAVAARVLDLIGFSVEQPESGRMVVQAGQTFDVYAIVTGTCSSAAGALGIAAAALILLPGPLGRRLLGAALAIVLFVALNILRIVAILGVGWVFATFSRETLIPVLVFATIVTALGSLIAARSLVVRMSLVLGSVVLAALVYDAVRGYHYSEALGTYHALAGPLLTFSSLAVALLLLWRVLVGRPLRDAAVG
jgi:hypothetical protein